ncbi:hypothetical protein A3F57_04140 [Candidatus Roizmanbacteria bacterium RIFCSPHIGHO2_12_FULL_36_11]|nr:MAG: hypothetical protein A3F57_04140 [Candidatus Roizmanbacteria bacterium RIFCSPHIGHO2_12_FULL_36_11]
MRKIAIITSLFSKNTYDGANFYVRILVQHLSKLAKVIILTTSSFDNLPKSVSSKNNIQILLFPLEKNSQHSQFNRLTHYLFQEKKHTSAQEELWLKLSGSYSPLLLRYLKENFDNYDFFFFIGYANALTYFGLPLVKSKAILIPLTHKEPLLQFKIFDKIFSSPVIILPSTFAEKDLIKSKFLSLPPLFITGININKPKFPKKVPVFLSKPYFIYIGRVSRLKGVFELIDYFIEVKNRNIIDHKLILIGKNTDFVQIPKHNDIIHFEYISQERKYSLLSEAEFLINPSYYESLSLSLLESWSLKKPVLANARCDVLKSQIDKANGGLYYEDFEEFEMMINWLIRHPRQQQILGNNGYRYTQKNYSPQIIQKKIKILLDTLTN